MVRNLVASGRLLRSVEPSSSRGKFVPVGAAEFSCIASTSKKISSLVSGSNTPSLLHHNHYRHQSQQHSLLRHIVHQRRLATTVATAASSSSSRRLESIRARRSALFDAEAERQLSLASSRLEKIKIEYENEEGKKIEMWMNKDLSTPRDCASHLKTLLVRKR